VRLADRGRCSDPIDGTLPRHLDSGEVLHTIQSAGLGKLLRVVQAKRCSSVFTRRRSSALRTNRMASHAPPADLFPATTLSELIAGAAARFPVAADLF